MNITVLGSGTSHGIPVIGCSCDVCTSKDPHDKRTRSSILVEHENIAILVDTTTDFRFQALKADIKHLDAVLMTHAHADHLHGLDDTRSLTYSRRLGVYGSSDTLEEIRKRFDYIFTGSQIGGGKPKLALYDHGGREISIGGLSIVPIPVLHGGLPIYGYRFGTFAYITDCSHIPESSIALLEGVHFLIINALRYRPHPTHFSIEQSVEAARSIGAREIWLTHLCHDISHSKLMDELELENSGNCRILPAYDGLRFSAEM
jgi:phosphoribosyl 1,2-cyclic phosphate phosphodiesterase